MSSKRKEIQSSSTVVISNDELLPKRQCSSSGTMKPGGEETKPLGGCEEEVIPADYECPICLRLLLDPVSGNCQHKYCYCCLKRWKSRCKSNLRTLSCPSCRQELPSRLVKYVELAKTLEIKFPFSIKKRREETCTEMREMETKRTTELSASTYVSHPDQFIFSHPLSTELMVPYFQPAFALMIPNEDNFTSGPRRAHDLNSRGEAPSRNLHRVPQHEQSPTSSFPSSNLERLAAMPSRREDEQFNLTHPAHNLQQFMNNVPFNYAYARRPNDTQLSANYPFGQMNSNSAPEIQEGNIRRSPDIERVRTHRGVRHHRGSRPDSIPPNHNLPRQNPYHRAVNYSSYPQPYNPSTRHRERNSLGYARPERDAGANFFVEFNPFNPPPFYLAQYDVPVPRGYGVANGGAYLYSNAAPAPDAPNLRTNNNRRRYPPLFEASPWSQLGQGAFIQDNAEACACSQHLRSLLMSSLSSYRVIDGMCPPDHRLADGRRLNNSISGLSPRDQATALNTTMRRRTVAALAEMVLNDRP